jgi:hypothetical protein
MWAVGSGHKFSFTVEQSINSRLKGMMRGSGQRAVDILVRSYIFYTEFLIR